MAGLALPIASAKIGMRLFQSKMSGGSLAAFLLGGKYSEHLYVGIFMLSCFYNVVNFPQHIFLNYRLLSVATATLGTFCAVYSETLCTLPFTILVLWQCVAGVSKKNAVVSFAFCILYSAGIVVSNGSPNIGRADITERIAVAMLCILSVVEFRLFAFRGDADADAEAAESNFKESKEIRAFAIGIITNALRVSVTIWACTQPSILSLIEFILVVAVPAPAYAEVTRDKFERVARDAYGQRDTLVRHIFDKSTRDAFHSESERQKERKEFLKRVVSELSDTLNFNPNLVDNYVLSSRHSLRLRIGEDRFMLFEDEHALIEHAQKRALDRWVSEPSTVSPITSANRAGVQSIRVSTDSSLEWKLTPPLRRRLMKELVSNITTSNIFIEMISKFNRKQPKDFETVKHSSISSALSTQQRAELSRMISGQEGTLKVDHFACTFMQLQAMDHDANCVDPKQRKRRGVRLSSHNTQGTLWWSLHHASEPQRALTLYTISNKVVETHLSDIVGYGILAFYVAVVLVVAKSIRGFVSGQTKTIIYDEFQNPAPILRICEAVQIARQGGELRTEEGLYWLLIELHRSPQLLRTTTVGGRRDLSDFFETAREDRGTEEKV
eukprot:g4449.t1